MVAEGGAIEPLLYGIFKLRQIDHQELLQQATAQAEKLAGKAAPTNDASRGALEGVDLSQLFGIEISEPETAFALPVDPGP